MIVVLAIADARDTTHAGVDAVIVGSTAAIVERRAAPPALTERTLKQQAASLARLEEEGLSLLPVRFGTAVRDEDTLKQLLLPMVDRLERALAATRGHRQMTVRVRGTRRKTRPASGRAFLEARARAARLPEADPVRRAVAKYVAAEETGPARGPFIGAVYHLVPEEQLRNYLDTIGALQRRSPRRFVVSGPMPPFAFTSVADIGSDIALPPAGTASRLRPGRRARQSTGTRRVTRSRARPRRRRASLSARRKRS